LNNAGERGGPLDRVAFVPMREDQFEPLEVQARLVAVAGERFAQLRRARGVPQSRQRENHL
jgi:hypothetical protein